MKEKLLNGLKWFFKSYIWLGLVLLGLDIFTKQLIMSISNGQLGVIADWGIVRISYVQNEGAAFGFGTGNEVANRIIYLIVATLISAGLIAYLIVKRKETKLFIRASLIMVITGAIGNMIDRIFYASTDYCVVDWIDFYWFWGYNFNIADSCIVVAAFMLVIYIIVIEVKDYNKRRKQETPQLKVLSKTEQERLEESKKETEKAKEEETKE